MPDSRRILSDSFLWAITLALLSIVFFAGSTAAQTSFEGRMISGIEIKYEGNGSEPPERFSEIARSAVGDTYSAVKIRNAIEELYDTKRVASVSVEAVETGRGSIKLIFTLRPLSMVRRVSVEIVPPESTDVTESDILLRTNLPQPGTAVSETALRNNADTILSYLRDRGYFRAEATFSRDPIANSPDANVIFKVMPGERALVSSFEVSIAGADTAKAVTELKLQPGKPFSREDLANDVTRVREYLRDQDFLAPFLNEPREIYDSETNKIAISLTGEAGPTVEVQIEGEGAKISGRTQRRLLPLKRDGTLEYSSIIEGERRLENYYQEEGYFFADVIATCSVDPPLLSDEQTTLPNDTAFVCSTLNSGELTGKKVIVKYTGNLDRRLKLVDIRIHGIDDPELKDKFTPTEIATVLDSQKANILGIVPLFGYGRGYTSDRILETDTATIRSLLRELGYRDAIVRANRGVSIDGESLIITFNVDEGKRTKISEVELTGNKAFSTAALKAILPPYLEGGNFSIQKMRNGQRKLAEFYSSEGYYDASVNYSFDTIPATSPTEDPRVRLVYTIQNEGEPVYVNRVLVSGNEKTKTAAIVRALAIQPGELLTAKDVYSSEQNLYSSDVFERVELVPQPQTDRPGGGRLTDVVVDVKEQAPRILSYGGGYSTDLGLSGFVDIRHLNLFGNLWQGGARLRLSQRQQLAQIDFINPRFFRQVIKEDRKDGKKEDKIRFAPLTITAQYQRDSTVTRFFRSAFDQGTFGIVQRVDENGNPIDEFGADAGSPTLNRFTLLAETNRTISVDDRSILFFRYRFEDVRLFNIDSLLIKDLLIPDSRVRISGFGATFVRDTRQNCSIKYTILDIIARGEEGPKCKYSASDPTDGDYLTAEYNVSLPQLGANIGFNKFQASYNFYRRFTFVPGLRDAVFAARGLIGVADVFSRKTTFPSATFPDLEDILPISERFFAGGSNTLRGFDFESAGPRVVVVPQGTFRNSRGEPVFLNPFTIPFGGNAIAVVNLETRIPLTQSLRAVPFYDGGNVFRKAGDIFKSPADIPVSDVFRRNITSVWTHTVGLGFRLQTPVGGEFGIDYGFLLNPPRFLIPQQVGPPAIYQLPRGQLHFRFSQAF
jgi:outer membrane protein insertion porin family